MALGDWDLGRASYLASYLHLHGFTGRKWADFKGYVGDVENLWISLDIYGSVCTSPSPDSFSLSFLSPASPLASPLESLPTWAESPVAQESWGISPSKTLISTNSSGKIARSLQSRMLFRCCSELFEFLQPQRCEEFLLWLRSSTWLWAVLQPMWAAFGNRVGPA